MGKLNKAAQVVISPRHHFHFVYSNSISKLLHSIEILFQYDKYIHVSNMSQRLMLLMTRILQWIVMFIMTSTTGTILE